MTTTPENTPATPVRYLPSKSLCTKVLQGLYGPTARFQTMHGRNADLPDGVRALVRLDGADVEIVCLTPKNGHTLADMRAEPGLWYTLLCACGRRAGCIVEADSKATIHVRRDPAVLTERLREIEQSPAPVPL